MKDFKNLLLLIIATGVCLFKRRTGVGGVRRSMESPESKARGSREQEGPGSEARPGGLRPLGKNTDRHLLRKGEVKL